MELTRRDALAALAGAGILGGGGAAALARDGFDADSTTNDEFGSSTDDGSGSTERAVVDALVATAQVVYPSAVENVEPFVETYATTKLDRRPEFGDGAADSLETLDAESRIVFDAPYAVVTADERETILRRLGVHAANSDPAGSAAERVRYYHVNEVLYALYTSPTGGELVGIENPQGYPGGTDSYQRGPRG